MALRSSGGKTLGRARPLLPAVGVALPFWPDRPAREVIDVARAAAAVQDAARVTIGPLDGVIERTAETIEALRPILAGERSGYAHARSCRAIG
jgi:hypothetical protein